jgi:hypothetical protein
MHYVELSDLDPASYFPAIFKILIEVWYMTAFERSFVVYQ